MTSAELITSLALCGMPLLIHFMLMLDSRESMASGVPEYREIEKIIAAGIIQSAVYFVDTILANDGYFGFYLLARVSNSMIFVGNMLYAFACFNLVYSRYKERFTALRISRRLFLSPLLILIALECVNIYYPIFFDVLPESFEYVETPLIGVAIGVPALYIVLTAIADISMILRDKFRYYDLPISLYISISFVGIVLEDIFYTVPLIPVFCSLSSVIVCIRILKRNGYMDGLSGLYTRSHIQEYLNTLVNKCNSKEKIVGILFDIDDFKLINDSFGHTSGDKAVSTIGAILREVTQKNGLCFRFGGDEFIILAKIHEQGEIDALINGTRAAVARFNAEGGERFVLSLSQGHAVYDIKNDSAITFFDRMDADMYKNKEARSAGDSAESFDSSAYLSGDFGFCNLKGLVDGFASGIAVYHGNVEDGLKPVLCNERLLKLLGISYEEFFSWMSIENRYATHPEDFERVCCRIMHGAKQNVSTRGSIRLKKSDGSYCNVLAITNIRYLDGDSFDWYVIYSELNEMEALATVQEGYQHELSKRRATVMERDEDYVLLNLTKNNCVERHTPNKPRKDPVGYQTVDEVFHELAEDIALEDYRLDFVSRFSRELLLKSAAEGLNVDTFRLPLRREGRAYCWNRLRMDFFTNPATKDVELFAAFTDVDNDVRMWYALNRMLDSEYEFVGQIDVRSQLVTKLGSSSDGYFGEGRHELGKYSDIVHNAINVLLPQEYWEEGFDAASFDRVLSELEKGDSYTMVFPTTPDSHNQERICRWKYEYVDSARSVISLVRSNITEMLEYGYDSLTGMLDRRGFHKKVAMELLLNKSSKYWMVDVDFVNFKQVNEKLGYNGGNRLLRRFAADIRRDVKLLGKGCVVGYYGADHFMILLPHNMGLTPELGYSKLAEIISGYPEEFRLVLRMGIYEIEDKSMDVSLMCDCAHLALMSGKGGYGSFISYYSEQLKDRILDEQLLVSEMQNAIETEQFEVWFQPQVNHGAQGALVGAEALTRWRHPEKGMISPAVFIPLFERNGFIYELDKYVWRKVCATLRAWLDKGEKPVPISVNVSRVDMLQEDFLETVCSIVAEYDIPLELVHFEVTESAFGDDAGVIVGIVNRLIELGFIIAIDDFGSGYSSLSLLRHVPAHIVKLDMRFFADGENQSRNECIVDSITRMVKMLGMSVLAEGVENKEQADFLYTLGCIHIQGYLYSKPLPYDEYMAYVENTRSIHPDEMPELKEKNDETAFLQSRELFKSVIAGSEDVLTIVDSKTKRLLYANRAAEQYFGRIFDPMRPMTCMEYCNKDKPCEHCPGDELQPGGRLEFSDTVGDRHYKFYYSQLDWNGHDAFVAYQIDISSEMKELEFSDLLIRNIPGATIAIELDETNVPHIRFVSERAREVFGMAGVGSEEIVFEDCFRIMHPEDIARVRKAAERSFRDKTPLSEEFRVTLKNGGIMWVEVKINPVADRNGKYLLYGTYNDITDRKNTRARIDTVLQAIPAAIAIYEVVGGVMARVFISDSAKEILMREDASNERISSEEVYSYIHEEDRQRVIDYINECFKDKSSFSIQFRLAAGEGAPRWVQLDSKPIEGRANDPLLYYSVYTDITAQKQFESGLISQDAIISMQDAVNYCLRESIKQDKPEDSLDFVLSHIGKLLHAERVYIIEKNADGTDSNTFEWAAPGVSPEIDNLQNVPEDICAPWYEQFAKQSTVIIRDIEDVKQESPELYGVLAPQNIKSLIAVPLFDTHGEPMGFLGLDNPPVQLIEQYSTLAQNIAFYVEATLKRLDLAKTV